MPYPFEVATDDLRISAIEVVWDSHPAGPNILSEYRFANRPTIWRRMIPMMAARKSITISDFNSRGSGDRTDLDFHLIHW